MLESAEPIAFDILILPMCNLNLISAVLEPLRAANRAMGSEIFRWRLLSTGDARIMTTCGIEIPAHEPYQARSSENPLFVLASYEVIERDWRELVRKLSREDRGRVIVGVETGSWLLAEAGLLNGYPAVMHWEDMERFAFRFSQVELRDERYVISADNLRITSSGSLPTLDLMISIIRSRHGIEVAEAVANMFVYDSGKIGRAPQHSRIAMGGRPMDNRASRAIDLMQNHIEDPLTLPQIADLLELSPRRLQVVFQADTGRSLMQYYLIMRLDFARRLIRETSESLLDISIQTGFASLSNFSRSFKRRYGVSPSQIRQHSA